MIMLRTKSDVDGLMQKYPQTVIDECTRLVKIYDDNYNCDSKDGGFVAVIENESDLSYVKTHYVDYDGMPFEFADDIPDSEFVSVLFLVGTEYGINLIIPKLILPVNITIMS